MWDMFESFSLSYFWDIAEPFQIFVRTEKTYKDNYKLNHERYLSYSYKSTFSIYSSPDFVPMFCFQYLAGSNVFFFLGLFFHFRSFFLFRPFLYILSVVYQFSDVAKHQSEQKWRLGDKYYLSIKVHTYEILPFRLHFIKFSKTVFY